MAEWIQPNNNYICKNCGLTYGSHMCGSNKCPGHEHRMDWDKGGGTHYEYSGKEQEIEWNTPAINIFDSKKRRRMLRLKGMRYDTI